MTRSLDVSEQPQSDLVTVTGAGAASAPADQVVVHLSVVERAPQAAPAFEAAAATATRVLAVLADDGVDARFVRTTDLTLGPRTDGRDVLLGYDATQRLVVRMAGLSQLPRVLTDLALQVEGGVRIDRIELSAADTEQARREARDAAYADARQAAEQLAGLAGRSLGPVRELLEVPAGGPAPVFRVARSVGGAGGARMPIADGDTTVTVGLRVSWQLVD